MSELFDVQTPADAEKLERVAKIRVKRLELGKWIYAPAAFEPGTLETHAQLYEIFGGGDYTIEFRDTGNQWLTSSRIALPGKPKSLVLEETAPAPAAPAVQPTQPHSDMALMVQLMMANMQQTTQILVAALTKGDSGNDKLILRSQALEDRARTEHTEFLKAMMAGAQAQAAAQPAAGGSKESFLEGIEWAQGMFAEMMTKQAGGAEDPSTLLKSMGEFAQGLAAVGREVANAGAGVPTPPNGTGERGH